HTTTIGVRGLVERKIPVVLVDRYLSDLHTSYVVAENSAGTYQATEHLILIGHRSFVFVIDGEEGTVEKQLLTTTIRDRYNGFCQALRDYHLAHLINPPYAAEHSKRESVRELLTLYKGDGTPLAIVAVNDHVATEIMNTAAQLGLNPPDDFAIVGFDDLPIASRLSVPLTTVIQPRYEIGYRAGHLLIDKMAGNTIRNELVSLLVSLIVRQSCGARRIVRQTHPQALAV
ncbi:MAG TPA: substrate-binding domain-containing protein, partial [Anaerolineae bacterium]